MEITRAFSCSSATAAYRHPYPTWEVRRHAGIEIGLWNRETCVASFPFSFVQARSHGCRFGCGSNPVFAWAHRKSSYARCRRQAANNAAPAAPQGPGTIWCSCGSELVLLAVSWSAKAPPFTADATNGALAIVPADPGRARRVSKIIGRWLDDGMAPHRGRSRSARRARSRGARSSLRGSSGAWFHMTIGCAPSAARLGPRQAVASGSPLDDLALVRKEILRSAWHPASDFCSTPAIFRADAFCGLIFVANTDRLFRLSTRMLARLQAVDRY